MGSYFKTQCQTPMFNLEHETSSDFYLSCFQKNRTSLPLLCVRGILFLTCVAIVIASMTITVGQMGFGYWFIYLTHWGLTAVTVTHGFAAAVSCRAYLKGPIEATFTLPWFVKVYWVLYNTATPMAFFITIYYYALLTQFMGEEIQLDRVLDFFIHGMNSITMFILLVTSRVPSRLLHFYFVVVFGLIYLAFSGIYYAAGGTDFLGNPFIYPTLDWSNPGMAGFTAVICAVALIIMHAIVVGMTAARDAIVGHFVVRRKTVDISNDVY